MAFKRGERDHRDMLSHADTKVSSKDPVYYAKPEWMVEAPVARWLWTPQAWHFYCTLIALWFNLMTILDSLCSMVLLYLGSAFAVFIVHLVLRHFSQLGSYRWFNLGLMWSCHLVYPLIWLMTSQRHRSRLTLPNQGLLLKTAFQLSDVTGITFRG